MRVFKFALAVLMVAGGMTAEPLKAPNDAERVQAARQKALAYVSEHRAELGLASVADIREESVITTRPAVVVRYQQLYGNVPVLFGMLIVQVIDNRPVRVSYNGVKTALNVNTRPTVTPDDAVAIARKASKPRLALDHKQPELQIVPQRTFGHAPSEDTLAWQIDLYPTDHEVMSYNPRFWIDAHSGTIISETELTAHAGSRVYLTTLGFKGMYAYKELSATLTGSPGAYTSYMQDPCYGTGLSLVNFQYTSGYPDARACIDGADPQHMAYAAGQGNFASNANFRSGTPINASNSDICDGLHPVCIMGDGRLDSNQVRTPGADAFINIYRTMRYLEMEHGREGLDGNNNPQLYAMVRFASDGAAWNNARTRIEAGGGPNDVVHYDVVSLDVIAHELGHALSDYTVHLTPSVGTYTGAIAEATSDMFAMLVSAYYGDTNDTPYRVMEQTFRSNYVNGVMQSPATAERYMDNPLLRGTAYNPCYTGGAPSNPHIDASPGDHAFYLMTYGGSSQCNGAAVTGIGAQAAGQIFYLGLMTLSSNAQYPDLKAAMINAAVTLYPIPSQQAASVSDAFNSVLIP